MIRLKRERAVGEVIRTSRAGRSCCTTAELTRFGMVCILSSTAFRRSLTPCSHTHTRTLKTCLEHVLFMIRDGEMLEAAPYNPHRRLSSGWVWRSETRAERAPTPGFQSRSAPDTPSYTHKHTQSSYAKQTSVKGLYNAAHKTHTNSYRLVPIHNDSFWLFPIDTDSFQFILTRIDRFWLIPIHTTDSDS